jgi:hypothetical protein
VAQVSVGSSEHVARIWRETDAIDPRVKERRHRGVGSISVFIVEVDYSWS